MKTNAELNLPEFDVLLSSDSFEEAVKQYPNVSCDSWKREFAHSYWQQGARWQFQECAKIIAARDAEIAKLKECLELWTQRNSNLQEKIRELESDLSRRTKWLDEQIELVQKKITELQAANSLIDELEVALDAIELDNGVHSESYMLANKALEKIKEYKQGDK